MLETRDHACGYWPERSARNIVLDAEAHAPGTMFPHLLAAGFRRSGDLVYRPRCRACAACVPVRVPVGRFRPNRAQRRCLARNADLAVALEPARVDAEVLELYSRYLAARHPRGGMEAGDADALAAMLLADWADTRFVCVRAGGDPRPLAIAITDVTSSGCSAVYTFFDPAPEWSRRSLGTFSILTQIALTRELGLPHLYLGYWLDKHPNMHYKSGFRPQQHLVAGVWIDPGISPAQDPLPE